VRPPIFWFRRYFNEIDWVRYLLLFHTEYVIHLVSWRQQAPGSFNLNR
jgi:hypothetical protein